MRVWSITDTGLVRKENQDAYFVEEMADCLVAAVCDGMGGPGGGREASAIAVQCFALLNSILVIFDLASDDFGYLFRF